MNTRDTIDADGWLHTGAARGGRAGGGGGCACGARACGGGSACRWPVTRLPCLTPPPQNPPPPPPPTPHTHNVPASRRRGRVDRGGAPQNHRPQEEHLQARAGARACVWAVRACVCVCVCGQRARMWRRGAAFPQARLPPPPPPPHNPPTRFENPCRASTLRPRRLRTCTCGRRSCCRPLSTATRCARRHAARRGAACLPVIWGVGGWGGGGGAREPSLPRALRPGPHPSAPTRSRTLSR